MNQQIEHEQRALCAKYKAEFLASPGHLKVGISLNLKDCVMPINGLRHSIKDDTTGWYFWGGEEFPEDIDAFQPLHVSHLKEYTPLVLKYLGLAPGWRFLITDNGYEDVWYDESLLLTE